jgi:glycerol-3-phosphate acyltransferase PlsX
MTSLPVALDAMGGDTAPLEPVRGAILAAKAGEDVILVGQAERIREVLRQEGSSPDRFLIVDAPSVVEMGEHAAQAARSKTDSSIAVACRLVREGKAGAVVSAGHSGATMATALLGLGRIKGIERPAIGTVFPARGGLVMLIDVGATVDCKPEWLVQFAGMGVAYAELLLGRSEARVGLLSIGEEATKGNEQVQHTFSRLRDSGLTFVGNVEPKDMMSRACDVAVCDGFVGNMVIKTGEAVLEFLVDALRDEIGGSIRYRLPAGILRPALRSAFKRLDYTEYGGAPLLGVQGNVVISHGRSNGAAMRNALRVGRSMVQADLWRQIEARTATPRSRARAAPVD